jgi:NAD(P)-dependent dehydrogenase (short-subunit alcohol dehydrogenase family)
MQKPKTSIMKRLEGKVIVITGAAMGLGLATAVECAKEGAKLALVDYNADELENTRKQLASKYPDTNVITITADVSDEKAVKAYVDRTVSEFGTIDGFYNNAGIEGKQAKLAVYDMESFKKVIDINLMGVYYGLRFVIPVMQQQKSGRIVNATSVGGIRGVLNEGPYVASKHAVSGLTKNAAVEYAEDGILINAIAPGAILTPMVEEAFKQMNPENPKQAEAAFSQNNPSKRLGLPEEVAKLVVFLLSEDCAYVNGQIIAIDGGQSNCY